VERIRKAGQNPPRVVAPIEEEGVVVVVVVVVVQTLAHVGGRNLKYKYVLSFSWCILFVLSTCFSQFVVFYSF
jgi:hypothetical protein